MRRFMMKISQIVAEKYRCEALVTGESLGQVASQTMKAIACTNAAVEMPVFRPLIGLDKDEIVEIARKLTLLIFLFCLMRIVVQFLHRDIQEQSLI